MPLRRLLTYGLGMGALVAQLFSRRPRIAVLTYHGIDETGWRYGVDLSTFRRQMAYIKKNCNPVRLADVVKFMRGEISLPDCSVAVTFDDGYQNVYEMAFPVLKELAIPMTFFVITSLEKGRAETEYGFPMASWDELRSMQASGLITVGSHSHTHASLDQMLPESAAEEIHRSREVIAKELGEAPTLFSYPKGRFSDTVKEFARSSGFEAAASIKQGLVRPGDDPYRVKRIEVNRDISFFEFKLRLTKAVDWLTFFWRKYHGFE